MTTVSKTDFGSDAHLTSRWASAEMFFCWEGVGGGGGWALVNFLDFQGWMGAYSKVDG